MNAPHRKSPPTAQLTLEIDGVPYTAQVTLTVGRPVQAKRSTALTVVPPPMREQANCTACAYKPRSKMLHVETYCAQERVMSNVLRGVVPCEFYTPSLLTRLLRAFRLGRAPVYLASPQPAEQDSSDRAALRPARANPLD